MLNSCFFQKNRTDNAHALPLLYSLAPRTVVCCRHELEYSALSVFVD